MRCKNGQEPDIVRREWRLPDSPIQVQRCSSGAIGFRAGETDLNHVANIQRPEVVVEEGGGSQFISTCELSANGHQAGGYAAGPHRAAGPNVVTAPVLRVCRR